MITAAEKAQSVLEMVAYRDMWGKGTDSYLHMMFERLTLHAGASGPKRGSIYRPLRLAGLNHLPES